MANPFYPPQRTESGRISRGNIADTGARDLASGQRAVPFDPDRRGVDLAYQQQAQMMRGERSRGADRGEEQQGDSHYQRRQPTDGPGGAATFYPTEYPHDPSLGTGTDGFGAGGAGKGGGASSAATAQYNPYALNTDYRSTFRPANAGNQGEEESPTRERFGDQHAYPPANQFGYSRSTFDLRTPLTAHVDRPDTPGIYPDRAPRMDRLSPEQQKIAKAFPKDLDDEGGSLLKTATGMCKNWRSFIRWKYVHYYVLIVFLCVLVALMSIYHRQIVDWLTPLSQKIRKLSWGWVIPVVILFILSFPPLFGHEIVGVLCGVVYGLWVGFGILSLGTLLGELGNFYAFKYFLQKHGERFEQRSIDYACMAHIVREGGFIVILLARLSAIPGHFTTAVFSTVGMNIFIFTIAAILSLPKQLVVVYLGVAIEQAGSGTESTRSKVIKWVVLVISGLVTVGVAVYLYGRMQKARPIVQDRLRARRYQLLMEAGQRSENVGGGAGHRLSSPSDDGFVKVAHDDVVLHESASLATTLEEAAAPSAKRPTFWSRVTGRARQEGGMARSDPRHTSADVGQVAMQNMAHVSYGGSGQQIVGRPDFSQQDRFHHDTPPYTRQQYAAYAQRADQFAYDDDQNNAYARAADANTRRPPYVAGDGIHYATDAPPYAYDDPTIRTVDNRHRSSDKRATAY